MENKKRQQDNFDELDIALADYYERNYSQPGKEPLAEQLCIDGVPVVKFSHN